MGERENIIAVADSYLKRAEDKLESAEILLKEKKWSDSISRAYYAAYLSAKAALLLIGEDPKTHSGLITTFSIKFVTPNLVDKEYGKILNNLQNARMEGDYNPISWAEMGDASNYLEDAQKFVKKMNQLVEKLRKSV